MKQHERKGHPHTNVQQAIKLTRYKQKLNKAEQSDHEFFKESTLEELAKSTKLMDNRVKST